MGFGICDGKGIVTWNGMVWGNGSFVCSSRVKSKKGRNEIPIRIYLLCCLIRTTISYGGLWYSGCVVASKC